jgi:hypothetical protein
MQATSSMLTTASQRFAIATLLVATASSCSRELYSPPSQLFAMPAARTLQRGQTTASGAVAHQGAVFNPQMDVVELGLRHGVTDEFDVEGSAGYGIITGSDEDPSSLDPRLVTARVGVITNPKRGLLTFRGGVGGGHSVAAGNYAAFDAGATVAYQSCVVTPSIATTGFVSNPFDTHAVNVSGSSSNVELVTPTLTVGYTISSALQLQLTPDVCRRGRPGSTLSAGFNISEVFNGTTRDVWGGFGLKFETGL